MAAANTQLAHRWRQMAAIRRREAGAVRQRDQAQAALFPERLKRVVRNICEAV